MSKIKIKAIIFSSGTEHKIENDQAIKKDSCITYNDSGAVVFLNIKPNKVLLTKESKDMKLNLEFEENKSLVSMYLIKDLKINIKIETKTKSLKINDNSIKIEYDLFMNDEFSDSFTYDLEWSDL